MRLKVAMNGKNFVKNVEIFLNTMQKISPENSYRYLEIVKNPKWFHSVMTSMTIFTQSRNSYNFVRIEVLWILTLSWTYLYGYWLGFLRTLKLNNF